MEEKMIPFTLVEKGKTYSCEIDSNEFLSIMQKIGRIQNDHMALTIEGIIPRMEKMLINSTRNLDRDVPDLNYWEKEEVSSRAISINRHHKAIWEILESYCKKAKSY